MPSVLPEVNGGMVLTESQLHILISGDQPEAGRILTAARESKGWRQADLAEKMNVSRAAVSLWEAGTRWPKDHNKDKLLLMISPDATVLTNRHLDARVTAQELTQLLHMLRDAKADELDQSVAIVSYAYPKVLNALVLSATGAPGSNLNPRSAQLFFEEREKILEEKRRASQKQVGGVNDSQAKWAAGDVYKSRKRDKALELPQTVEHPSDSDVTLELQSSTESANGLACEPIDTQAVDSTQDE